jgi:hypothetical protein
MPGNLAEELFWVRGWVALGNGVLPGDVTAGVGDGAVCSGVAFGVHAWITKPQSKSKMVKRVFVFKFILHRLVVCVNAVFSLNFVWIEYKFFY